MDNATTIQTCAARPTLEEAAEFLTEYSAWLFGSGATCIRLEKNVVRIAESFGCRVEITSMPRHLIIYFHSVSGTQCITSVVRPKRIPISFDINSRLSSLSWQIADGKISFSELPEAFEKATHPGVLGTGTITALVSIANASFCRLFGGDVTAMAVVAAATLAGYALKGLLVRENWDIRIIMFLCAFVSSVIGATATVFSLGTTPSIALGTSILYLVPGIPFLNSFSDMLYRHYICSFSRFFDAVLLTCSLSAGLCAGMAVMHVGMF